jgi:hypothetical protein
VRYPARGPLTGSVAFSGIFYDAAPER